MSSTKQARRTLILDTVIRLLASRGLDGVTHRAIDEAAGLPAGLLHLLFSEEGDPPRRGLPAIWRRFWKKDCDELQVGFADIAARQGVDAAVDYVAGEVVSYADSARDLFLARMELTLAASRRPELKDVGDLLTAAARRPVEFFLRLISEGRTEMPIETCAGLIDGISLMYATGQGPKPTTNQIAAVFRAVL